MKINGFTIRSIKVDEIDEVSELMAAAYYSDIFFKWCVDNDSDRCKIVSDYYKVYLRARGCVVHVAENSNGDIIGASVWLPHDTDASIYEEIEKVVGIANAPMFNAVAENSHMSEPPMRSFYQLVGFGVLAELRGAGVGYRLLKYHLDILDELGIPTYLEASTPYYGGGVYGKFGYRPVGELMVFSETAVLHPLWRHANTKAATAPTSLKNDMVRFGGLNWNVLNRNGSDMLLLSENILELKEYNDVFESTTWFGSSIRNYLNNDFLRFFTMQERECILETHVHNSRNPWYGIEGGSDTVDKVFLLSIEEVVKYLGDSGKINPKSGNSKFFIDDSFNNNRSAKYKDGSPSRWLLRTPGSSPDFVATVTIEGKVSVTGDFVNRKSTELFKVGVRPAIWYKG